MYAFPANGAAWRFLLIGFYLPGFAYMLVCSLLIAQAERNEIVAAIGLVMFFVCGIIHLALFGPAHSRSVKRSAERRS